MPWLAIVIRSVSASRARHYAPTSAELAPDQKDEDSLPPYEVLDEIVELYVEGDASREEIIAAGFSSEDVQRVID